MSVQDTVCGQLQAAGDGDVLIAMGETPLERELFDKFVLKVRGAQGRTGRHLEVSCVGCMTWYWQASLSPKGAHDRQLVKRVQIAPCPKRQAHEWR